MVKGRMLEIVRYLENERMASYKEIAGVLDMKERTVRYDVDCINNELSLKKAPLIEKYPKGMLFVPVHGTANILRCCLYTIIMIADQF